MESVGLLLAFFVIASTAMRTEGAIQTPAVLIEKVFGSWRLYDQAGGWVKVVRIK